MNLVDRFTRQLDEYTSPVLIQDWQSQDTINLVDRLVQQQWETSSCVLGE